MSFKNKATYFFLTIFAIAGNPIASYAATARTFNDIVNGTDNQQSIVSFVNTFIVPLLYALIFLFFIFGVVRYFFTGGEENRQKGKQFVIWALLAMVAVFSVWGVVNILLSTLGV